MGRGVHVSRRHADVSQASRVITRLTSALCPCFCCGAFCWVGVVRHACCIEILKFLFEFWQVMEGWVHYLFSQGLLSSFWI